MIDGFPRHVVSITIGGKSISGWTSYEVTASITEGAARFSMAMPFSLDAWKLCKPDEPIRVLIDNTPVLTGYVDSRALSESNGDEMQVSGRDKCGRLVQESVPSLDFRGLKTEQLIAKVSDPWFKKIVVDNDHNRDVRRGKGKKAKAHKGKSTLHAPKQDAGIYGPAIVKSEPGQSRWSVIEQLCEQQGLVCFSSADGETLFAGQPNYNQESNYRFFMPRERSPRARESTVIGMGITDSVADRYSRIVVVGSGGGSNVSYGQSVSARHGEVKNNSSTLDGEGLDFRYPKRLVIVRAVHSLAEAKELARREMARRDTQGHSVTVVAPGHGQLVAGQFPTLFAPDTMADVDDERTGTKGAYLIASCSYRSNRQDGEQTSMTLVPKGSELSI